MLLFSLGLLALPLTALAQGGDPGRPALVILTDRQDRYPLGRHLELLEDPTGQLTIEEVSSPAYDGQFTPSQAEVPNFGYTPSTVWARFQVRNQADPSVTWRLAVDEWRLGYVDLYVAALDGAGFGHEQAGRFRPFTIRDVPYRYGVFNLQLPPDQAQTIYVRVQSVSPIRLPLTLWSLQAFNQHAQTELLVLGVLVGTLLVMVGYNVFLFAALRDRSYLYLAMFITSFGLAGIDAGGLPQQYLWPTWRNLYGVEIGVTGAVTSMLLFAMSFLQTKIQMPRLHTVMLTLVGIALLVLALRFWWWSNALLNLLILLTSLIVVVAGYLVWRRGHRPARYFLLAWLLLLGTVVINFFINIGLLANNLLGPYSVEIGAALMVLLLSLALADRLNLLQGETEQANLSLGEEIQQRKIVQQALGESEEKYRTVVEQAAEGILVMQGGRRKYYNPAWLEMTGYSAEEYDSIPFLSLIYADDLEAVEAAYQNLLMGQDFEAVPDFRMTAKSGDIKWLSVRGARIEWEGKPAGMVFIKDITERKQAEEALQERKERYRLALETGHIGLWQWDLVTGQSELDGAVEQIIGYSIEELRAMVNWEEHITHPEDRARVQEEWQAVSEGRHERYDVVHRMLHKDGSVRWVEAQGTAVRDENGQVIRILGTSRDITATRRAEELVAERAAELVEANQTLQREIGERRKAEAALLVVQGQLEQRVAERTAELEQANQQLSALLDTLEQRVADRTRELTTFLDLTMLVSENRSLPDILDVALDRILEASQCQAVCLQLLAEDQTCLELTAQRGLSAVQRQQLGCLPLNGALTGWLAQRHEPVLDLALPGGRLPAALRLDGFPAYVGAQLRARERVQGLLSYYRTAERPFSLEEISLLGALAEQLGIAIENQRLRGRIEAVAVVAERQRLARDLHDSINQSLYSLNLFAHAGQEAAADGDTSRLAASLARVEAISLDVLREMRLLLFQLQPAILAEKGLAGALELRLDSVERRLGIKVDYQVEGELELPDGVAEALYQAALEALNNALKHAHASQVSVHLELAAPTLRLEILDNGQGFDPAQTGGGMGLKNIRDRLEQVGGGLEVSSAPGSGTRMVLAVDVGALEEN